MTGVLTTRDHDAWRRTVNNRRHYVDVGLDQPVPSATSIKPEAVFRTRTPLGSYAPLDAVRAAEFVVRERERLVELDPDMLIEEIADAPRVALAEASRRGLEVHDYIAAVALGDTPPVPSDEARPYVTAAQAFLDDYSVEFIAAEVIVVIPDLELAGTIDAIIRVDNRIVLVDWKTRRARHGAYPTEVAQLGVYAHGSYIVVGDYPGERLPLPELDEAAIVSLAADATYALYPVDLAAARSAAQHMRAAHVSRQLLDMVGQRAVGDPVLGVPEQTALDIDQELLERRIDWIRGRIRALTPAARDEAIRTWPRDVPRSASAISTNAEIDAISEVLWAVERAHQLPFPDDDPGAPPLPPGAARRRERRVA